MSEQDVWACIQIYRTDSAKDILKKYGSQEKVLQTLSNYRGKDEYHGHASGKPGDAESPSATQNLNAAIKYLELMAPALNQSISAASKGPNKVLKAQNESKTRILLKIISDTDNLNDMVSQLNLADPKWQDNRQVLDAYTSKRAAKKAKFKSQ
jgi:hypothetical protein